MSTEILSVIQPKIAVLVPCYNEEAAIADVVTGFAAALPSARIYVYDNNSSDRTREVAAAAGATVRSEPLQGKGHVVRRMFADIDADAYVLVDGDATYDPTAAPDMVRRLLDEQLDMVNGQRIEVAGEGPIGAYRRGHRTGNLVLTGLVRFVFGDRIQDMLSGYRVFSRRFVKTFPALASGFETETEFTIHALDMLMPLAEVPTHYRERPPGSVSKLRTYSDGFRILSTIIKLVKEERPLQFFCIAGLALLVFGLLLALPVLVTYFQTGFVPRLPTAVLSLGVVLLAMLSFACGLILDSVARGRREAKRLAYLTIPRWEPPQR
ncbi:glycosyltransferase family 2 protein [Acidocella sp. MX-AZ02]|uniref:glycosyltransferase family 2 protein n=1 Tax=Acidocella sp. MX-AZ02 TaxID=1214225 RepID=UPI00028D03E9|nr:glycosyltransferase family 2 protein [Acidocella sp. MX-AZ02]EKN00189.1 family 2 glycosyl transferase [Acidocella sp. MX-AZ02]